jgi:phosphoribosylamine--glycine ligase
MEIEKTTIKPVISALRTRGCPFVGVLYPGIMLTKDGPKVIEFNARFGDPETQVFMRLLKTDLFEIFEACIDGRLHEIEIEWNPGYAVCVVMVSAGYPSPDYQKGSLIVGIDKAETLPGVIVFQAGTKRRGDQLITSGGRVLCVTGVGETLDEAIQNTYKGVHCIHFDGMQYRRDIGAKSLSLMSVQ